MKRVDATTSKHTAPRALRAVRGSVVAFALVLLLFVGSALAYKLFGIYWQSKQVTMRTGGLGSGGPGGGATYQQLSASAMAAWNASCNPDPDFDWNRSAQNCSPNPNSPDGTNCTGWLNLGQCSSGTVTLGTTYIWYFTGTNFMAETDVGMNSSCSFNQTDFLGVLTHENGHVMGLDHSSNSSALMYAFYGNTSTPQNDDCNGARAIYGSVGSNYTLSVSKSGSGTVTSNPSGINCGGTCSKSYPSGTVVTLSATPASGWTFSSWSGNSDCNDGTVTMNSSKSCTATFAKVPSYTLSVSKNGSGTVTSSPAGINCGGSCFSNFVAGTVVTLSASAASGWTFSGWSGAADCNDGKVTMNSATSCTATFTRVNYTLSVSKVGSGTVTSSPSGINCGPTCSQGFPSATVVTLTPTPDSGWVFSAWSGHADCSDGKVTMNSARSCTATFTRVYTLSVSKTGTGAGTVKSSPAGINCGATCETEYLENTVVFLSGKPAIGSELTAWSGDPDCADGQVTMSEAVSCTAVFNTCSSQSELTLEDTEISGTSTYSACNFVHIGPNVTVTETGRLVIHTGNEAIFYSGVDILDGGELEIVVAQPMP